ncbi:MAG: PD-(D/E)XK nuclease family protein, partial [Oscillospiraceae bacterium]|nr:PD-(D/E)XK nuclease family protein [Oscillospiraceae bacterium]
TTEHLKQPFTFKNQRLETDNRMMAAEEIRKSVAEPLWKFSKKLPHGKSVIDGAKLTEMLYDYLINTVNIRKALFAKCVDPENSVMDGDRTALYQRLWDTLMRIFDTLHDELEGVEVSLDEYYKLFRDICAGTTLASPPQLVDRVLVGDIDRTRADNVKAAFIVGASFDLFPTPAPQTGIFSQYETELLRQSVTHTTGDQQTELCLKSAKEQYSLALYRAYRAVCLPTEYLCLSFSENDPSGESMQISGVSEEILKMFPDIKAKRASEFDDEFYCRSVNAAKLRFALSVNSGSRENAVLSKALRESGCADFVSRMEELKAERSDSNAGEHKISADTAALLFPTQVGATDIENMSKCKFSFFCEKGLGITQRTQRSFNSFKRGDAIHFVLENILRVFNADIDKFCRLIRREFYVLSRKFLEEYCRAETNNSFFEDARSRFLFNNIANSAADVLITMQTEFCSRRYRPKFFELDLRGGEPLRVIDNDRPINAVPPKAALYIEDDGIGGVAETAAETDPPFDSKCTIKTAPLRIPLNNGRTLTVSGRIDRVDMFTENDVTYVRAVDYKSSVHSFDINNAKSGINIQMLLYLSALLDANRDNPTANLTAGGISYVPSAVSGALNDAINPFRLLAMNHRPSGLLILDDVTQSEYAQYSDTVINKIIEDDGKTELLNADETALTEAQLRERTEYQNGLDKIKELFRPNEQNSLSADEFGSFLNEVKSAVGAGYSALLDGNVSALPLEYTEKIVKLNKTENDKRLPCKFCRFADICKNAGKNTLCVVTSDDKKSKTKKKTGGERA